MTIKDPLNFVQMYGTGIQPLVHNGYRRSAQVRVTDDIVSYKKSTVEIHCIKNKKCRVTMGTNHPKSHYISVFCNNQNDLTICIGDISIQSLQSFFQNKVKYVYIECLLRHDDKLYIEHSSNGIFKMSFKCREYYIPPLFFNSKDMAMLAAYNERLFVDKLLGI